VLKPDAGETGRPIGLSMPDAAARVERLGFVVVNGATPGRPGGANLVVALRPDPTLSHFDPELVQYWESAGGRGRPMELTGRSQLPISRPYAWGVIRVVDRLNALNSFLSFGGSLRVEAVGPALTVAVFASPAPIARWTGHSQEPDPLAGEVGAFFAQIRVPIDFQPEAEARIAAAAPVTLYAALLQGLQRRLAGSETARAAELGWGEGIDHEAARVHQTWPVEWEAAGALVRDLGLERG
jgi:hypothetical protein